MENRSVATKTLVIGLDGATFALLQPLMESGRMPFLTRLAATGATGPLRSTLPPVTAPAWSSFFTGKNPGKHGLFTWQRALVNDSSHRRVWVSSRDIRGDKIWHILGRAGWKVGIMNTPMTYPPEAVNGFMISGLLTPGPESPFTYPTHVKEELFELAPGYVIDVGAVETDQALVNATNEQFDRFVESVTNAAHLRTTAAIELARRYQPDFFMLVYTLPDRLQHPSYHYMLAAANDPTTPDRRAQASIRGLIALDQELERLVTSIADEESLIIFLSDHGFCHHRYNIYLNGWLVDKGFLNYKGSSGSLRQSVRAIVRKAERLIPRGWVRAGRQMLSAERLIDWPTTKAYCGRSTENGLFLTLEGREPFGIVRRGEYESLRRYLRTQLAKLVNPSSGEAIFKSVYFREEVYQGAYVDHAPDIVFEPQEGYKIMSTPVPSFCLRYVGDKRKGIHAMDGILVASGPMIQPAGEVTSASIMDVTPTILHALNFPIPDSMDGQVIMDIFRQSHRREIRYAQDRAEVVVRDSDAVYSDEDAAGVEKRLQKLGYLD
jgi:predicted AlkP superfamily phosphohydrolase/phosphomutase